jgi:hypothetical protein
VDGELVEIGRGVDAPYADAGEGAFEPLRRGRSSGRDIGQAVRT